MFLLLIAFVTLRLTVQWPGESTEQLVLVGVLVIGLLPILLAIVDVFIERGGAIEYAGVKLELASIQHKGLPALTVPVNVGVRGAPVSDSSTTQIMETLKEAAGCNAIIVDLEDGSAWWETRLLVLLAGAQRLGKPDKVVFVGADAGKEQRFQGWAHPEDLLPLLSRANPQYLQSLKVARAAARQWELVEPAPADLPPPPIPPWMLPGLATQHPWMAFDQMTRLPNELLAEQLLAADLGSKVEMHGEPKTISLSRLDELFRPVLNKERIDQDWPVEQQLTAFFDGESPFIAVTQSGKYSTIISRLTVLSRMMRSLVDQKQAK